MVALFRYCNHFSKIICQNIAGYYNFFSRRKPYIRYIGGECMTYKFKDLIVTVVPEGSLMITRDTATVGSCSSEGCDCNVPEVDEVFDKGALSYLNPQVQNDLRQMLVYSLAKSNIKIKNAQSIQDLEEKMRPKDIKEVEKLEKELTNVLDELKQHKKKLKK